MKDDLGGPTGPDEGWESVQHNRRRGTRSANRLRAVLRAVDREGIAIEALLNGNLERLARGELF